MTPYSIDCRIAAQLHWSKLRMDSTVRRVLIKHGAIPDPLARAVWNAEPVECPACHHRFVPGAAAKGAK